MQKQFKQLKQHKMEITLRLTLFISILLFSNCGGPSDTNSSKEKDVTKMLASYNAGPGNFSKWSKNFQKTGIDPIFMIETLPARQTRNYIKLVLTNLWIYKIRLNEKPNLLFKLASGTIPKYEYKDDR